MTTELASHTAETSRLERELALLGVEVVTERDKGCPSGASVALADVGAQGWNILDGTLPLPLLVLRDDHLQWNIDVLQGWCDSRDVLLAPHAKTSMCPHIWHRQLAAGAWGMTVANIGELQVAQSFGVPRLLLANEVAYDYDVRALARALNDGVDVFVLVDSEAGVELLNRGLTTAGCPERLSVLVEVGMADGRTGARTMTDALELAWAVKSADRLRLAGVEGYEGVAPGPLDETRVVKVDEYLAVLRATVASVREVAEDGEPFVVSAGGSMYFDRVVAALGPDRFDGIKLILRSGGYVTHDSEFLELTSPLARGSARLPVGQPTLRAAFELWSVVLSSPEPGLAILGFGRRDAPVDQGYPLPQLCLRSDGSTQVLGDGFAITAVHDQHAYLRVPPGWDLRIGDVVRLGVSHPCAAFDRWRLLFLIDGGYDVVGAVRTFF